VSTRGSSGRLGLVVAPIACDAHGLCAELLPEMIHLDEWGYPIIDPGPVPAALLPYARRAVGACPTLALKLRRTSIADR
jgi:ferredoxin